MSLFLFHVYAQHKPAHHYIDLLRRYGLATS